MTFIQLGTWSLVDLLILEQNKNRILIKKNNSPGYPGELFLYILKINRFTKEDNSMSKVT